MSDSVRRKLRALPGALARRLRRWLTAIAAVAIIATAVVVGVGRALIPLADELRPWLERTLSERLDQPVVMERVEARWPRLTPQITLHGVRAGPPAAPLFELDRARLELHLPALVKRGRNPLRLVVLGLDLLLTEDEQGRWGLHLQEGGRLPETADDSPGLAGDLLVRDLRVRVRPRAGPRLDLVISEGELRRDGDQATLVARAHPAVAPEAELALVLLGEWRAGRLQSLTGRAELGRLRLEALDLDRLLPDSLRLPPDRLDMHLTVDWARGRGGAADLDFALNGDDGFAAAGRLRLERRGRRIDAELLRLSHKGRTVARNIVLAHDGRYWAAEAPELDLERIHALLGRWLGAQPHWPQALAGQVDQLALLYQHPGSLHRLEGSVAGLTIDLPGDRPGLRGLDLDLGLAGDRAALTLAGSPVLDWPARMRQPVAMDSVSGRVIVSPRAVELDGVAARRPEAQGRADGWIWLGGGRPFMDFVITSRRIDAIDPRPWLPAGQIPPRALAWLDRALLRVGGASGGLNYHFRLGHRFSAWQPGDFQAWVRFQDADIDFWPGWPVARQLDGEVDFVGRSLNARVARGRLDDLAVAAEEVVIADLSAPEVALALSARGADARAVRKLFTALPFEGFSRFIEPLTAAGRMSLKVELLLPVGRMADWRLAGQAMLAGTTLSLPAAGLRFPKLEGALSFDRSGIAPAALTVAGEASERLEIAAGFSPPAWLEVAGSLSPARVLAEAVFGPGLADNAAGQARWQARLGADPAGGWQLDLRSDLKGLALQFPQPLIKPAGQAMPLALNLRGGADRLVLGGQLGELLKVQGERNNGRWRLAAGLGEAAPALPAGSGFEVTGRIERLALRAWSEWLGRAFPESSGAGLDGRVGLQIGWLDWGDWRLQEVAVAAQRARSQWRLNLSGPAVEGEVTIPVPLDSGRVIAVDLNRLALARANAAAPSADLAQAAIPAQTQTRVPTELPPIHLLIESLSVDDLLLGRARVESHARSDGIEVERVEVIGPHLELSGHGRWVLGSNGPISEFQGRLSSTHLSELLAAAGLDSRFEAERSQIDLEGRWTGAPHDFSLARLNGRLHLLMVNGRIPDAQPGAGRLVGLISLSAMPRRLMLDFRDVFGQGLSFDRIEGQFDLAGGVARTDDLRLASPAADIFVSGRTDLGAQTYDQTVLVEPAVSGTLPVLGGLAGGPAGVAAGLLLRGLLERPLQEIAEARYRVTGPWQDPTVELIGARPARLDHRRRDRRPQPQAPAGPDGDRPRGHD